MSNRLAIFDCDGTLVDAHGNISLAMERCFAEAGLPLPPREHSRRIIGLSLVEAMREMLPIAITSSMSSLPKAISGTSSRCGRKGWWRSRSTTA
jgi:phosphoglycolate phosphatase